MKNSLKYFVAFLLTLFTVGASAQDFPFDIKYYPFVDYKKAVLSFSKDSSAFNKIYSKLDSLILFGKGNLNIVQIGASHTQADIFSHRMRVRLQTFHPGLVGSRGFVFPYKMTKSNNPTNYSISWTGLWTTCRNVEWRKTCDLGISGASATTTDINAKLTISMSHKNEVNYDFNEIKIFTAPMVGQFDIVPDESMGKYTVERIDSVGLIDIKFEKYQSVAKFHFERDFNTQTSFTLYGFDLCNDNPGVTYSALGINGASLSSWLKCVHFERQLKHLNPDWFIIFLGVNDGNSVNFKEEIFYSNYVAFIDRVRRYCPNAVWTFVVPNDFYLLGRRPNPAMELEQSVAKQLVEKYNQSMFSIFESMGGLGSSLTWVNNGLMAHDKVHMTVAGYNLCADMFFNAFLQSYSNYLDKKNSEKK